MGLSAARITMTTLVGGLLATASLAGCGSSGHPASPSPTSAQRSSSSPAPAITTPAGTTHAQTVLAMDKQCAITLGDLRALPTPKGDTDYDAIFNDVQGQDEEFRDYIYEEQKVVDASADSTTLQHDWIDVENADYATVNPLLQQALSAAENQDGTKLTGLLKQIGQAPNHSAALAKFLTGYGATTCAKVETSGR